MNQQEAKDLFREIVPESNYKECQGCHTGSTKCAVVHTMHTICPCSECLVKTSCTDYCSDYIHSTRLSARNHKPGKMIIMEYSNKGYTVILTYKGQKIQFKTELWRHIDPRRKQAMMAGYHGL